MSFVSYAQNFEDVLLWRALSDVQGGRYIDVGAHDPVVDSVSCAFYEAGWRGMHVEPIPHYAAKLREARPDECVIEAAVTDHAGPILFYELSGLSSGRSDVAEHHARSGHVARQMFVPTVGLDDLLKVIDADVHWLKIDVEGMEADVLRSWGKSSVRPWILVIEATFPNTQEPTQHLWIDEVVRRGYEQVFFDGLSCYFLHEDHRELAPRFEIPPNYFDQFTVTGHHFSAAKLRAELEQERANAAECKAEFEAEKASMEERIQSRLAERHAENLARAEAEAQALRLGEQLIEAQRSSEAAIRGLAAAERDHSSTVKRMWAERFESETLLRAQWSEAEQGFRQSLSELEIQLRQHAADLAAVREREAQLTRYADQLLRQREAVEQQRDELNRRLAVANNVIERAIAEPDGRWQRIGQTLGFAEDRAKRALRSWHAPYPQTISQSVEPAMFVAPSGATGNPYLRANSLPELLSWHDVDFVRCAYVTVLGRQPDREGEAYYTDRIRRGYSKLEILWQLRKSPEGPSHDPGISGFDRALKRAAWARRPILGWPARLLGRHSEDSDSLLLLRALRNDLSCLAASNEIAVQGILSRLDQLESNCRGPNSVSPGKLVRSLRDPIQFRADLSADQKIDCLKQAVNSSQEAASLRS